MTAPLGLGAFAAALTAELGLEEPIAPDARLVEDLALDSLGLVVLLVWMEDLAGVVDPDPDPPLGPTVADLHRRYRRLAGAPPVR